MQTCGGVACAALRFLYCCRRKCIKRARAHTHAYRAPFQLCPLEREKKREEESCQWFVFCFVCHCTCQPSSVMNCKKKYMNFRKKNISVGARSRAANWWLSPRHHSDEDSSMLRIPFPLTPLLSVVTLFAALQRPWPVKLLSADRPCACYRRPWFMYMQSMLISPIRSDRPSK